MHADVTGLILAGGESERFGAEKARHRVQDRTMIRRVYDAVAQVAPDVLVGAGKPGRTFDLPARHVYDERRLDEVHGVGPLGGLHAGLRAATRPWILVAACDLPFLTVDALRSLLDARGPDVDAVVARTSDGRLHPLCAAYHRTILPLVDEQLSANAYAMHALIARLPSVRHVSMPDGALRNVNRLSDLPDGA